MANEKIDMGAFVRDIREKQGLDAQEPIDTGIPTNSESTIQGSELKKMGRPKKGRKIENGAPVSVFFDQETKSKLVLTKVAHKIEMKDLVVGATLIFLDKYYDNGRLSEAGQRALEKKLKEFYGE